MRHHHKLILIFIICIQNILPNVAQAYTIRDVVFDLIGGEKLTLSDYSDKTLLIVNTASFCGFTQQYSGLQALWERYKNKGLVIIGVPSKDFGGQEYDNPNDIANFCEVNFNIDFPLTMPVSIIRNNPHQFFTWVSKERGRDALPKWNFYKYLINKSGDLVKVFPSSTEPLAPNLINLIEQNLQ